MLKADRKKLQELTVIEYIYAYYNDFSEKPFSEIDGLILSLVSYLKLDNMVGMESEVWLPLSSLYRLEEFEYLLTNTFYPNKCLELIKAICASPRYRDILMNYHIEKCDKETEEQFSAITFQLPTG